MQSDRHGFSPLTAERDQDMLADALGSNGSGASDASVQAALASLSGRAAGPKAPRPGELKWKLTTIVLPSVMLLFVALYVTSLSAGVEPEVALFRAGGAGVVLAVLGRVAVSILGDESRLVLSDDQIATLARSGPVREYLSNADGEHNADGADQRSTAAQAAGPGGKE